MGLQLHSAGAIVIAGPPPEPLIAILHRRHPPEWRLPKGKLHAGETPREAARREVAEEIGLPVDLDGELGCLRYDYHDEREGAVRKQVRFYLARLPAPLPLQPEAPNFDEARWVSPEQAEQLLRWDNEREMVRCALALLSEARP